MNESIDQTELLKAKILGETSKIPWSELQRFFAQGRAILVDKDIDLVDVAMAFSSDQADQVKDWLGRELIAGVSDEQAKTWIDADAMVWAVVVRPWVLVQQLTDD